MSTTDESLSLEAALLQVFADLAAGASQASEVADRLAAAGVTGRRISAMDCPLARHATQILRDQGMLGLPHAEVVLWYTVGGVDGWVQNMPTGAHLTPTVTLPTVLYEFARAFDRQEFPALVEEASV